MSRYYRHIRQSDLLIQDEEGIELRDLDGARAEAIQGIRDILAEGIKRGTDSSLDDAIIITDEAGQELMTIPFIEALPPRLYKALLDVLHSTSKSVLNL